MAVDHVVFAILDSARGHVDWIGTGEFRFSHGKTTPDLTASQRDQIARLLFLAAKLMQQLHVSHIGSLTVEGVVPNRGAPQLQGNEGKFQQGEPHPP